MKNRIFLFIISAILILACSNSDGVTNTDNGLSSSSSDTISTTLSEQITVYEGQPEWAGIWGAWGSENYKQSWLKGSLITIGWSSIEKKEGVFDFSKLEQKINKAVNNGQYFIPAVYVASIPEWIFDKKVPKVYIDYNNNQENWEPDYYAYYLDDNYKYYVRRMWSAFQKYIALLPTEKRKKFVGFQVPMGRSGDSQPYPEDPVDSQYDIQWQGRNADAWTNYQIEMTISFLDSLKVNDLYNSAFYPIINFTDLAEQKAKECGISVNRKSGMAAQAYNVNGEMVKESFRKFINSVQPDGSGYIRCRGEFDNVVKNNSPWLNTAPVWHYYWQCQWMLTFGLDLFMQRTQTIEIGNTYKVAFDYFNDHVGYKDVSTARYAYVVLRDGLDVSDTNRFLISKYGGDLNERYANILAEMSPYGAKNDDLDIQYVTSMWNYLINRKGLNDACYNNWSGNYGKYLNQIDPNVYDQGYWRVGSKEVPYGRYARGFDIANNKNTMYFDLDDNFYGKGNDDVKSGLHIKVIYYDNDEGSWNLLYHASDGTMKSAIKNTNGQTSGWKTIAVILYDALLNNGGEKGADFIIENAGDTDIRFHMLEIDRGDYVY